METQGTQDSHNNLEKEQSRWTSQVTISKLTIKQQQSKDYPTGIKIICRLIE